MYFFLFNRTTLQVFVTYLIGALYVNLLWFYKHQHDNRVRSKLFVACQWWWFQWRFWFVPSVSGYLREEEEHKPDPWRNPIEKITWGCIWRRKCIVYDKLLKPRQLYWITLYILFIYRYYYQKDSTHKIAIQVRSRDHCSCGKARSIKQSECVNVDLIIKHIKRMRHIVIRDLDGSTIRFHIISFIHSLAFSLRGRAGRNQSPVMWPVWLWHTASWASSWVQFAIAFLRL